LISPSAHPTPLVSVEGLTQDYPGFRALDDVTFAVAPGTVTALVGPNGAGKTTLMRCLAALDPPLSGRVIVDGLDAVERPREVHRRIGFLQDFFGLYDSLTVAQGLWYAAAARGVASDRIEARVQWAARAVSLDDRLDQRAGTLSRGLRQRLAVAQSIVHQPRVVLLDEPASGLDPESRAELAALLRVLRADHGMTLLVSSHILAELEHYSTHIMILNGGRLLRHDAITEDGRWGSSAATDQTTVAEVTLADAVPGLADRLDALGLGGLARVPDGSDGRQLAIDVAADEAARAGLLRRLVEAGLPVSGFVAQRRSLQDVYLDHMRRPGGGRPPASADGAT